jgi:hypothetical protein
MPMGLRLTSKRVLAELVRRKDYLQSRLASGALPPSVARAISQERDALLYAIHLVDQKVAELAAKHEPS